MLSKSVRLAAGQRVRLPSGLSPLLSFLLVIVSALSPFCLPCLRSPFCPVLSPFLLVIVVSFCLPSCWSLCPLCLPSFSFCLPACPPSCWLLCRPCLPSCLPLSLVLSPFFIITVSIFVPSVSFCFLCCGTACPFVSLLVRLPSRLVIVSVLSPFWGTGMRRGPAGWAGPAASPTLHFEVHQVLR